MYKLRELEKYDIPLINSWRSNRELISYLGAPFRYINKEIDYKWYENYVSNRSSNVRCSILNENNDLIGLVSLTNIDRLNQSASFHIMIGDSPNRNKGVGYFASQEILNHAFLDLNLNRIELSVLLSNNRAISLYKKVGFKKEGIKRSSVYKNGKYEDMLFMSILKKEFLNEVK